MARTWIEELEAIAGKTWIIPTITSSAEGEHVYEWWCGKYKLTIYVNPIAQASGFSGAEYYKIWGTEWEDMEDGTIRSVKECRELWTWLLGGKYVA